MVTPQGTADLVAAARAAVGQAAGDDYVVAPTRHAAELEGPAPALAAVLRGSGPETAASEFERLDAEALEAQQEFKRVASRANTAVFTSALLGAGLMLAGLLDAVLSAEGLRRGLMVAVGATAVVVGGLAVMWLHRLKQGELFERWMRARAGAETRRLQYFERVVAAEDAAGSAIPLPLLQLEYFRRHELDVEVSYYRTRQRDHRRAADRTLQLESFAVLLATVATGLGGLLAGAAGEGFAAIGAVGVGGAALAAFAATRETISQDRRNVERYGRSLEALVALRERLDEVRAAAAAGHHEAVRSFVAAVHEQISVEHRQWLESADSTRAGIARLDAALAERTKRE